MTSLPLASEFPPASHDDWRKRVAAALKGADFDKRLTSHSADGIAIAPVYEQASGPVAARPTQTPWTIVQRMDHPGAAKSNEQALADLENGASGLCLITQGAASARGFGLAKHDPAALGRALKDVRIDAIALRLDAGTNAFSAAQALANWIATQPVDPERLDVSFGLDPVGAGAIAGETAANWASHLTATAVALRAQHFRGPFAHADGRIWHDAGASEAQELAFTVATALAYLRALDNLDHDSLERAVSLTFSADQDMFLTLAKFRAARLLWARVLDASGLATEAVSIHAETSWRMMTGRDPHMNILRATAAVFGAGLGGADAITVLPFSLAQGLPNAFARRIARNTQTVLLEESNLWRVADPASGAGYAEHLTRALCDKAWAIFQDIEKRGGIGAALKSGQIETEILEMRNKRMAHLKDKTEMIIGATAFPPPNEARAEIEDAVPVHPPYKGFAAHRPAEDFEATP